MTAGQDKGSEQGPVTATHLRPGFPVYPLFCVSKVKQGEEEQTRQKEKDNEEIQKRN
jgi:hypothetical protein